MVAFNMFYGATPTLEEAAAAMSQYFWDTLYRPYLGFTQRQPS